MRPPNKENVLLHLREMRTRYWLATKLTPTTPRSLSLKGVAMSCSRTFAPGAPRETRLPRNSLDPPTLPCFLSLFLLHSPFPFHSSPLWLEDLRSLFSIFYLCPSSSSFLTANRFTTLATFLSLSLSYPLLFLLHPLLLGTTIIV